MTNASTFVKVGNSLRPFDPQAEEMFAKMKDGKIVLASVSTPRNPKQHRLFFAVMKVVAENSDWTDVSALKDAILVELGYVEAARTLKGKTFYVPQSIAFGSMDQETFGPFFDKAMELITSRVIPGTGRDDLMQHVDEMLLDKRYDWQQYTEPTEDIAPTLRNLPDRLDRALSAASSQEAMNALWTPFSHEYRQLPDQCKGEVRLINRIHQKRIQDGDAEACARDVNAAIEKYRKAFDGGQGAFQQ